MDSFPDGSPAALSNAACGAWLKPLIDAKWHDMHAVVPRGFPAYVRIFHPAWRDRPEDTRTWHGHEAPSECGMEDEVVGWSAVAEAFGKQMHALAQFDRLPGPKTPSMGSLDAAGWRYSSPDLGNLAPDVLAAAAIHLCDHTGTPDQGVTAVWNGWGGLGSSAGYVELIDMLTAHGVAQVVREPLGVRPGPAVDAEADHAGALDETSGGRERQPHDLLGRIRACADRNGTHRAGRRVITLGRKAEGRESRDVPPDRQAARRDIGH